MSLYNLNRDMLVDLVSRVECETKKELTIYQQMMLYTNSIFYICNKKGCESFVVNGICNKNHIIKCNNCEACFCTDHSPNRIFAGICSRCQINM